MTIAEVLASGLVPIFISPIPGQEVFNVLAFESYGIGGRLKDVELIRKAVRAFMDDPQSLQRVRRRVREVRKPHAAEEIYRVVRESCAGASG
jgi:UDP-N-acetylglucosamine:LPS N-acetylglucosamine transferase